MKKYISVILHDYSFTRVSPVTVCFDVILTFKQRSLIIVTHRHVIKVVLETVRKDAMRCDIIKGDDCIYGIWQRSYLVQLKHHTCNIGVIGCTGIFRYDSYVCRRAVTSMFLIVQNFWSYEEIHSGMVVSGGVNSNLEGSTGSQTYCLSHEICSGFYCYLSGMFLNIFVKVTSLDLGKSYGCITLKDMGNTDM